MAFANPLQLEAWFRELNNLHFDGFLDPPTLRWNTRLRASAGRFTPGRRKFLSEAPPVIELATYLLSEPDGERLVKDTLGHEMIHYWLWVRRRPYGHTEEFHAKMRAMGVSRYNSVPKLRPPKYTYECPECRSTFPARRRLGPLACRRCCDDKAGGRYDRRFSLRLLELSRP